MSRWSWLFVVAVAAGFGCAKADSHVTQSTPNAETTAAARTGAAQEQGQQELAKLTVARLRVQGMT